MLRLGLNGYVWEVVPSFRPLLATVLATAGETVRRSPAKLVTRHAAQGRIFYIKRYRHEAHWWRPPKYFFKTPRSLREWRLADRLAALDIPCVPHLAHGERRTALGLLESVLVTEALPGYQPADADTLMSQEAQRALGGFTARLHDAGVRHDDFHGKNLLYSRSARAFCLVDLDKIRLHRELCTNDRLANLARLASWLALTAAFFEGYGIHFASYAGQIAQRGRAIRRRSLVRRSKRCLEKNGDFQRLRTGGRTWWVRSRFLTPDLREMLNDPNRYLAQEGGGPRVNGTTRVGRFAGCFLKRYKPPRPGKVLKELLRHSPARRAYRLAYHLERAGIATARPVALADRSFPRFRSCGYLATEEINGAVPLAEWRGDNTEAGQRLAELLARLHDEGFSHPDLNGTNILFDSTGQPVVIDLDTLRYLDRVPTERAAADLARLARKVPQFSLAERARVLRRYAALRGQGNWRWWWKQIEKDIEFYQERKARRSAVAA